MRLWKLKVERVRDVDDPINHLSIYVHISITLGIDTMKKITIRFRK
jgi:hypothetical protein